MRAANPDHVFRGKLHDLVVRKRNFKILNELLGVRHGSGALRRQKLKGHRSARSVTDNLNENATGAQEKLLRDAGAEVESILAHVGLVVQHAQKRVFVHDSAVTAVIGTQNHRKLGLVNRNSLNGTVNPSNLRHCLGVSALRVPTVLVSTIGTAIARTVNEGSRSAHRNLLKRLNVAQIVCLAIPSHQSSPRSLPRPTSKIPADAIPRPG